MTNIPNDANYSINFKVNQTQDFSKQQEVNAKKQEIEQGSLFDEDYTKELLGIEKQPAQRSSSSLFRKAGEDAGLYPKPSPYDNSVRPSDETLAPEPECPDPPECP